MEKNEDGFWILAKTREPMDSVYRYSEDHKKEFQGYHFVELKISEKYGPQLIFGSYGFEGKWPIDVETEYKIARPRNEDPIASAEVLSVLFELQRNIPEAIKMVKTWERQRGLR